MPPKKKAAVAAAAAAAPTSAAASDPLDGVVVAVQGKLSTTQAEIKKQVAALGGDFATSLTKNVTHLISTQADVNADAGKVKAAVAAGLPIVSEEWLQDATKNSHRPNDADFVLTAASGAAASATTTTTTAPDPAPPAGSKRGRGGAAAAPAPAPAAAAPDPAPRGSKKSAKTAAPDPVPPQAPAAAAAGGGGGGSAGGTGGTKIQVTMKGKAPVDPCVRGRDGMRVIENGDEVFNCMLNQTNIGQNNNKFYVVQALQSDSGSQFWVFTRWGRVGENGQQALQAVGSRDQAIAGFTKKFKEKTSQPWSSRASFTPVPGKYTLIEIDYGDEEEEQRKQQKKEERASKAPVTRKESTLHPSVQNLIRLIFDMKMMSNTLVAMEYDIEKMPLGKLKKATITKGYATLKALETEMKGRNNLGELSRLSSEFYTLIPHSYSRSQVPPVIRTDEMLKTKMQMLEALADIEIATTLIAESEDADSDASMLDLNYGKLKCHINKVTDPHVLELVRQYVTNSWERGKSPNVVEVYSLEREGERARFDTAKHLGNRKMLWHGSRLTNYVGIISQGLRIAPPEAPCSGYRFGKGVYFADMMSLSARYCRTSGSSDFCMLLGDVALGRTADLARDKFMTKAEPGSDSTLALGVVAPDPRHARDKDGCSWPVGPIAPTGKTGVSCHENQFVIYDVAQCNLQYLLHLRGGD